VRRVVFPDPLGPTSRKDGRCVELLERYMMRWRNRGMENAIRRVKAIVVGEGERREDKTASKVEGPPITKEESRDTVRVVGKELAS
jgi:hypothetical protein